VERIPYRGSNPNNAVSVLDVFFAVLQFVIRVSFLWQMKKKKGIPIFTSSSSMIHARQACEFCLGTTQLKPPAACREKDISLTGSRRQTLRHQKKHRQVRGETEWQRYEGTPLPGAVTHGMGWSDQAITSPYSLGSGSISVE
jgi:hypothetical protein